MKLQYGIVPVVVLFLVLSTITPALAQFPAGGGTTKPSTSSGSPYSNSMNSQGASNSMVRPATSGSGGAHFGASGYGTNTPAFSGAPKQAGTAGTPKTTVPGGTFGSSKPATTAPGGTFGITKPQPQGTATTPGGAFGSSKPATTRPATTTQGGPFGTVKKPATTGATTTTSGGPFGTTKSKPQGTTTTPGGTFGTKTPAITEPKTSQAGPFGKTVPKAGASTPGESIVEPAGSTGSGTLADKNKPAASGPLQAGDQNQGTAPKSSGAGTSTTPSKSAAKPEDEGGVRQMTTALVQNTQINQNAADSLGVRSKNDGSGEFVDKFGNEYTQTSPGIYNVIKSGDQNSPIEPIKAGSQVEESTFHENFGGYGSKKLSDTTWEDAAGNIWEYHAGTATEPGYFETIKEGTGMKPPTGTGEGTGPGSEGSGSGEGKYHPPKGPHPFIRGPHGGVNINVFPLGGGGGFIPVGVPVTAVGTIPNPGVIAVAPPGQSAIIGPPQGECSYNSAGQTYFDSAGNVCLTNGKDWGATGCGADAAFAVILSPAQGSCSFNSASGTYMDPAGRTCWSDGKYWFTQ